MIHYISKQHDVICIDRYVWLDFRLPTNSWHHQCLHQASAAMPKKKHASKSTEDM